MYCRYCKEKIDIKDKVCKSCGREIVIYGLTDQATPKKIPAPPKGIPAVPQSSPQPTQPQSLQPAPPQMQPLAQPQPAQWQPPRVAPANICPRCGAVMQMQTVSKTENRHPIEVILILILLCIPIFGWIGLVFLLMGRDTMVTSYAVCPVCGWMLRKFVSRNM